MTERVIYFPGSVGASKEPRLSPCRLSHHGLRSSGLGWDNRKIHVRHVKKERMVDTCGIDHKDDLSMHEHWLFFGYHKTDILITHCSAVNKCNSCRLPVNVNLLIMIISQDDQPVFPLCPRKKDRKKTVKVGKS